MMTMFGSFSNSPLQPFGGITPSAKSSRILFGVLGIVVVYHLTTTQQFTTSFFSYECPQVALAGYNKTGQEKMRSNLMNQSMTPALGTSSSTNLGTVSTGWNDENNNDTYEWIGNQWIPPPGVPIYRVDDYRRFFQRHNVLFIGDSTMRRAYATIFAMINASSPILISVDELDHPHIIDINKYSVPNRTKELCRHRSFASNTARGRLWNNATFLCRHVLDASHGMGKFDFANAACYKELEEFINTDLVYSQLTSREYTILVIGMGTWETSMGRKCEVSPRDGGPIQRLNRVMDYVAMLAATADQHKNLTIVWRTTGFHKQGIGDAMNFETNRVAIEAIHKHKIRARQDPRVPIELNLTIVDWGRQILPRSHGNDRIDGDIKAHYGLQGRTLFAQMLLHNLLSREKYQ